MPLISVIVPVYKVEPYLHQCVDSILNQTFKDFELILVDDGSPDNCPAICDEYAKQDNRVKVIHKENGGLFSARNIGLDYAFKNSNSKYICFVDSDDYIDNYFLEYLYNGIVDNHTDISYCCCFRFGFKDAPNKLIKYYDYYNETIVVDAKIHFQKMIKNEIGGHVCFGMFSKDIIQNIHFPNIKFREDLPFHCEILLKANYIFFINKPLYYYRVNYNSLTRAGTDSIDKKYYRVMNAIMQLSILDKSEFKNNKEIKSLLYSQMSDNLFSFLLYAKKGNYYKELNRYAKNNRKVIRTYNKKSKMRQISTFFYYIKPLFSIISFLLLIRKKLRE